ncbi:MAG: MAPEG family protein [Bradymonadia bacterium]
MVITPLYLALVSLLFIGLTAKVILGRRGHGVSLGDGEHKSLRKAIRAHGNCAEYAPFSLLLMVSLESQGGAAWQLHLLGSLLLVGRAVHAYGLTRPHEVNSMRIVGMVMTLMSIIAGSVMNLAALRWGHLF